jgi:dihydroorotate dehydrogenase (NAD+) catalytic subunit
MSETCDAKVVNCRLEKGGSKNFLLEMELESGGNFRAQAGQFMILSPLSGRSVMPRPFSIADVDKNVLSILFRVVGENTRAYSQLRTGDQIRVFGPKGSPIQINSETKNYILVGGGIGSAALTLLSKELAQAGKDAQVLLGAKNSSEISGVSFFMRSGADMRIITEKEGRTRKFVTDLLEEVLAGDLGQSQIIACGPKPMLKKVFDLCEQYGNECSVIVEEIMACGMGSCKGCAIFGGKDGNEVKHVCEDGPAFDAKWIYWPKFMPAPLVQAQENKPFEEKKEVDYTYRLGPLVIEYPLMNCSGTLDIGACENGSVDISKLGAFVTKGLSIKERPGNPMPRICEVPSGMINSIGLEYIGLGRFLKEILPRLIVLQKPVIVNINASTIEEYVELARALDEAPISAIEVNISCPNVKVGGMLFGKDPDMAAKVTEAVRKATTKPVICKLTPNVTDIVCIARAVADAGADIISLINTVSAAAIDVQTRRSKISTVLGGLSGPCIRPIAIARVIEVYRGKLGVPIIGMGGIEDADSAAEFFLAGANAVAIGTGEFSNRSIFTNVAHGLEKIVKDQDFSSIDELIGNMIF